MGKVFGAKTEDAVKRFQADVGLKVDGDVGIRTATALKAYHSLPKTKDDGTEPTKDERINAAKEAIEKGKADKKFTDQNIGDKAEAKIAQSASKLDPTVQTSGIAANTVQSQTAAKQHAV